MERHVAGTNDSLLDTAELARRLEVKPQTIRTWRLRGEGPTFIKLGSALGRCRYSAHVVEEWLKDREHRATSELRAVKPVRRGRKRAGQTPAAR